MTSKPLLRLQSIMKEGWDITKIHISFNKEKEEEIVEVEIVKGNDKDNITSINDDELIQYILHFKKFTDEYGNEMFIYVDDLDEYEKMQKLIDEKAIKTKRKVNLDIGQRTIKFCRLDYLIPAEPGTPIGTAQVVIDTKEYSNFCELDLRDDIEIRWADTGEVAFGGSIHKVMYYRNLMIIIAHSGSRRFTISTLTGEFLQSNPIDVLYFLGASGEFNINFPPGKGPNLDNRIFEIYYPLVGLDIPSEFKITSVSFTIDINAKIPPHVQNSETMLCGLSVRFISRLR